MALFLS
jgi:hypothetical protein